MKVILKKGTIFHTKEGPLEVIKDCFHGEVVVNKLFRYTLTGEHPVVGEEVPEELQKYVTGPLVRIF